MAKIQIVLEKIYVAKDMIKDHDIKPVRIVIIIKGDCRTGINYCFIRIARIQFVPAFFLEHLNILHPVVIQGGNHHLGAEFNQISVGNNILKGFILEG